MKRIVQISGAAIISVVVLVVGCSTRKKPEPVLLLEPVTDPARELCMDDSRHRTVEIQVPFAKFNGHITLNGAAASEVELRSWAMAYYPKKAEQALWVEIAPNAKLDAERILRSIRVLLPGLRFREVDSNFDRCPSN